MANRSSRADLLAVVEAAYQVDVSEDEWLHGVLEVIGPQLDMGMGVGCYPYDARNPSAFSIGAIRGWRLRNGDVVAEQAKHTSTIVTPDFVERTYRSRTTGLTTDFLATPEDVAVYEAVFPPLGIADTVSVNAGEPDGRGYLFWAHTPVPIKLGRRRAELARMAAHLAAGRRLRERLAEAAPASRTVDGAEAVITPSGRVDHAEGEAAQRAAREALSAAVARLEVARGRLRRDDPPQALALWTTLASGRWSLVDHFEAGGRRLLVAQRNEARTPAIASLTTRERLAVAFARQGHSNKMIAYHMGIAASTVGVLLHRAARRLGAATREGLIAAYKALEGDPDAE